MTNMKKWTKKDFRLYGHFTGSRLKGHEHDYVYDVYWGNSSIPMETGFSSKRKAEAWLGEFLRKANRLRAEYDAKHPGVLD